jgi:ferric enterobactin receptor
MKGIDFLVQKKYGDWNGWIGYTIGSVVQNYEVYGKNDFYASNDVTHEFKVINCYKIGAFDLAATWIYASGKPYTAPQGGYSVTLLDNTEKSFINISAKNGKRLPDYHRFDIAATYNFKWGESPCTLGASLFNLYNRKNVWYKEYQVVNNNIIETNINYLGLTPNITFSYKFR